jgi:hypothetical protein
MFGSIRHVLEHRLLLLLPFYVPPALVQDHGSRFAFLVPDKLDLRIDDLREEHCLGLWKDWHFRLTAGLRYQLVSVQRDGDRELGKDANPGLVSTNRRPNGTFTPMPGEELSRMRSFKIADAGQPGNAVFNIVLSPGKVEAVKYISGSQSLKGMEKQIAATNFGVEFPDAGPIRLYRRGMAVCEKAEGCNVVLLLPDSVHAVDQSGQTN